MAHPLKIMTAETLSGTRTITSAEATTYGIMTFDPGGAGRSVVLPDPTTHDGQMLLIANTADAAEVLTISDGVGTCATPTQAESAIMWCDGVRWRGIAGSNA